jgi:uncharacterized protein (DUF952 family)
MEQIVHICLKSAWETAQLGGEYRPDSFEQDSFIHASRPEQVLEVANRYYRGVGGLVILWVDPDLLHAGLRWESSDGQVYPHIYGALNLEAVVATTDLEADQDGIYRRMR